MGKHAPFGEIEQEGRDLNLRARVSTSIDHRGSFSLNEKGKGVNFQIMTRGAKNG